MITDLTSINPTLLEEALTHRSYLNENKRSQAHNERLEFLGDAVLELAVSEYLFEQFPDKNEGDLTAYRAALVRTTSLSTIADKLELGKLLRLSKGEEISGGRTNPSLMANTFEAVLGALYLDQGYKAVVAFLSVHLFPNLTEIIEKGLYKDYKSSLQEYVQAKGSASPEYQVVSEAGPDHAKSFTIEVLIDQKPVARGSGKSKQHAQQSAARKALEILSSH
jgi:ribonuclease III